VDVDRVVGGRYRLRSRLGTGGMGTVWRAYDELLQREVAIKEILLSGLRTGQTTADVSARALAEARNAARLHHPNIVSVHDVLSDEDRVWIVMALVVGRSLQEVVEADGPLDAMRAAQIGLGLLDALDAAHAAGVVHRDVKPSNVLLPDAGGVMLTDFSIAAAADTAGLTQTGVLLGTPGYVAPERVATGSSDPPVDLFGVGATLYFATEGRGPFERDTALAALFAAVNEPHPPPAHAGPLAEVIDGLLAKVPGQRWPSTRCRETLRRVAGGAEVFAVGRSAVAPPPSPGESRPGWARRPVVAAVASTVLLGALVAAMIWSPAGRLFADLSGDPTSSVTPTRPTAVSTTPRTSGPASPTASRPPPAGDLTLALDGTCSWYSNTDGKVWVILPFVVRWASSVAMPRTFYNMGDDARGGPARAGGYTDLGSRTGDGTHLRHAVGGDPAAASPYAGRTQVRFTVRIDPDDKVVETSESNNTLVIIAGPFGAPPPASRADVRIPCRT